MRMFKNVSRPVILSLSPVKILIFKGPEGFFCWWEGEFNNVNHLF